MKKCCIPILHGSVHSYTWLSETFWYCEMQSSFVVNLLQKLSESVTICKSYGTKFTVTCDQILMR